MSFEEYLDINYNEKLDDLTKFLINDAFKAGAQSRQAEIDELQKRIDEALIKINKAPNQLSYNDAIEALLILKGKNND